MHLTKSSIARVCGLALGALLAGCGSSGGTSGGDPTAPFVGTWTYSSGSIVPMMCSAGLSVPSFDLSGDPMTVTKDGNMVAAAIKGNGLMCNVNFTVSGSIATATAGQTCTVMVNAGTLGTITGLVTISTFTLTVSGDMLSMAMTGTATAEGGALTCPTTASGSATRPPADGGAGG